MSEQNVALAGAAKTLTVPRYLLDRISATNFNAIYFDAMLVLLTMS